MAFLRGVGFGLVVAFALMPLVHVVYAAWVRRRHPALGEMLVHAGSRIHYLRTGSGPAVVLVHGANGTSSDFPAELIVELSRDHTVLALDRPGHGWSTAPRGPLGLEANAAAVLALARELELGPVTLVGHSYGAAVALRAALDAPEQVSRVVAVCPCSVVDRRNMRYSAVPLVSGPLGAVLLRFFALPAMLFGNTLRTDAWYPAPAPPGWGPSRVFAYVPAQMHVAARNFRALHADVAWLEDHLPKLRVPLVVLGGAQDLVTPPARHVDWLRRVVPGACIQIVPRTGHWLPRLQPEFVVAAVRGGPALEPARASAQSGVASSR